VFFAETLVAAQIDPVIQTAAKYKMIDQAFDAKELNGAN
jgi:hypothetical protein